VPVSNAPHRRRVAIAVTSDGRRVQVPLDDEVTPLSLIRSLLVGIESVIALLIPGHRRDH
jgi:hypothetical protein